MNHRSPCSKTLVVTILLLVSYVYARPPVCSLRSPSQNQDAQKPLPQIITPTATKSSSSALPTKTPFPYGEVPVRGVNLGGWLVLEPWITPSLFANLDSSIRDEYTFGLYQSSSVALSTLDQHWSSWITEEDFKNISAAGLNHVRIPVGYWSIPSNHSSAPFITGAYPYLLKAISWADTHNISVIIDLHGAPGSQNGYDNSGHAMSYPQWQTNTTNVNRTLEVISTLVAEFSQPKYQGVVTAIELLNEPGGFYDDVLAVLKPYWQSGYDVVRAQSSDLWVIIEDGFKGLAYWKGFMNTPEATGVMMDTHVYQIFSNDQLERTWDEHIQAACSYGDGLTSYTSDGGLYTIIGEWTPAPTDCAQWLNGRGRDARWSSLPGKSCDGFSGDMGTFSSDYKDFLGRYWAAQTEVYERAQGWIQWAWKTEIADEWSYQKGLEGGWIPSDPSQRDTSVCN